MGIDEVYTNHTPNQGREIWNNNDNFLAATLDSLVANVNAFALNVKTKPYGAVGDGKQDDAPAIQSAIQDCYTNGGGYVYIPAGVYKISSSIILLDNVNIFGAGMHKTKLILGDNVNQPVITDISALGKKDYAFGRVTLSNFGIDGNKSNNLAGGEGIFTSGYFSVFENLKIENCYTHGLRIGVNSLKNGSSQNRVSGCRISNCNQIGLFLDINGIDQTVTENYIYSCRYGIVIKNGGTRVVNNDIYNNQQAGIQIGQTSYGVIIANNDLNGNARDSIHITRTTLSEDRTWSQLLVVGNSILGNNLDVDNFYSGILVETAVDQGIDNLSITANKIFSIDGDWQFRYGVNLQKNVEESLITANHIHGIGTSPYFVGADCNNITIDNIGGGALIDPSMPPSGRELINPFHTAVTVYISGGLETSVLIDGKYTGLNNGGFHLPAGKTIAIYYHQPPKWSWFAD